MNLVMAAAEMSVYYAFPEVGAAMQTYRYARTMYNVANIGLCYLTGDIVGGTMSLVSVAGDNGCLEQRDVCIQACMRSGMWNPGIEAGACVVGCDLAYRACIALI